VGWGGESEGKGKTQWLGQRQFNRTTKGEENNYNNANKKNMHSTIFSPPYAQCAPEQQLPSPSQLPHLNTEHDITWYQILRLFG